MRSGGRPPPRGRGGPIAMSRAHRDRVSAGPGSPARISRGGFLRAGSLPFQRPRRHGDGPPRRIPIVRPHSEADPVPLDRADALPADRQRSARLNPDDAARRVRAERSAAASSAEPIAEGDRRLADHRSARSRHPRAGRDGGLHRLKRVAPRLVGRGRDRTGAGDAMGLAGCGPAGMGARACNVVLAAVTHRTIDRDQPRDAFCRSGLSEVPVGESASTLDAAGLEEVQHRVDVGCGDIRITCFVGVGVEVRRWIASLAPPIGLVMRERVHP